MLHRLAFILLLALPLAARAQLPDFTDLVEKQSPAVVNVSTTQKVTHPLINQQMPHFDENDPFYDFFKRFMPNTPAPRAFQSTSLGSGFVITADGYIMTNAHVVDAADEIVVKLNDKREFKAKVIGADKRTDVALLKIEATGLQVVRYGDPDKLKVGEWVVAIGSPFGFDNSVTAGIVSAKGRTLPDETYVPFIQSDVAVNPGNSGGPLFNMRGEVVGINSQIYSRTGGFMGLSFAIPIDVANDVVEQIRSKGKVTRGRIGVVIQPVTRDLAESFGLPRATGALVTSIEKGGPADKAGVQNGDVILKFDGKTVNSSDDLPRIVAATKPGSKAVMQVMRDKTQRDLTVAVTEMPADTNDDDDDNPHKPGTRPQAAPSKYLGMSLKDLTPQQRSQLKLNGGVLVDDAQGAAARAGLHPGDIIIGVSNQDVKSLDDFMNLTKPFKKGEVAALLVKRGGNSVFVPLRIE